jgi:hypothetical protein
VIDRPQQQRSDAARGGIDWTARFDAAKAVERYLAIYQSLLGGSGLADEAQVPS